MSINPMQTSRLSIIIPALNEEDNLSALLSSIKKQNFKDYEVIVADAGSKDKTREVAFGAGCKIIKGGLPAKGRNEGAKSGSGGLLLFLDADVYLPDGFLEKALSEFSKRKLDIASFFLTPSTGAMAKSLFNIFYNFPILVFEKVLAHAAMGILVKKDIFEKAGGFNELISLAEDHYFARQAQKIGKYGLIKNTKIFVSPRRFKKDGWIRTGAKYFLCEMHMIFLGPVKRDFFKYNYQHLAGKKKP